MEIRITPEAKMALADANRRLRTLFDNAMERAAQKVRQESLDKWNELCRKQARQ